ncbi:protein translocase subunit SecF [Chengkuizengella axinellae]|uniref:Protein-export membrane protein SecF n=1 Tax=Chengkuizengella axinellae TaxID=3064388 RepID=A0ABT9ITT8_9BACL|nr:protein translocase subunit SecF [Chengkuizengella sp. 2205SS18-9]MDP5272771.1 protein translocase subunit SecF [Chengkuizengella sp. 2205SS18-9]
MNFREIDFVKNRKKFFSLSIAITVLGLIALLIFNLNYGVDFTSGTTLDVLIDENSTTKEKAEQIYQETGIEPSTITVGGDNNNRVNARFEKVLSEDERIGIISAFQNEFGAEQVSYEENTVDAEIAKELGLKAIYAVAIASIGIIIYVSIRFEWRFALTAVVALLHDAFIVISLFSIFQLEVNLPFVAAVLTIIGYSINDTIVIFDRIRENLQKFKIKNFDDLANMVNTSIKQTLTRSINTALTVVFAAFCLFIFGSESIKLFSLAMLIGLISGAYSSIFIASQLWLILKSKSLNKKKTDVINS